MNIYDADTYYAYPVETWSAAKCAKVAKSIARDGLGTPYPWRGACPGVKSGPTRYNGGIVIADVWYPGVVHTLPTLAPGYKWVHPPSWCWRLVAE